MRTLALPPMNPVAIERANERLRQAAEGRIDPVVAEAALERARHQVESLAETAAHLEATLPDRVGEAVQAGLREQVLPVAKHLAEVRGLSANAVRRLERLETDLLAVRRPAKRVRQQVRDDLQDAVAVGLEHRGGRDRAPVVDAAPPRLLIEPRVGSVDKTLHVDLFAPQREAVRVELRQVQDVA